jgi:hypothetical protein
MNESCRFPEVLWRRLGSFVSAQQRNQVVGGYLPGDRIAAFLMTVGSFVVTKGMLAMTKRMCRALKILDTRLVRLGWISCLIAARLLTWPVISFAAQCDGPCGYPPDSGIVNVRDFGAKGDGRADDTAALQAAINAAGPDTGAFFWRSRIVFLPDGIYRVSAQLQRRYANGAFGSGMILLGQSTTGTVIRLTDHAVGFGDPGAPRGVVMTTAKLLDGTPTSGGKDYSNKGEGNDAYENFVENLTIDVGADNPGAIGIDYLANNIGAIRDVVVTAPQGSGATGIAMTRKWPGPALLQRVTVHGFGTGIAVANTEYGVTLDHVRLDDQRDIGLANDRNEIAADHLSVETYGTAIANTSPMGLIVLANSDLRRAGGESDPLDNRGVIVAQGVAFDGYQPIPESGSAGRLSAMLRDGHWKPLPTRTEVALDDAPPPATTPLRDWVNVLRFASPGPEPMDITDALRRAFASKAATVYLPFGRYTIHAAIDLPATLRRFVGMNASITVRPEREPDFARTSGMFRIAQSGPPLTIERLAFDMTDLGDQLAVEVAGPREVVLRDIVTAGTSLLDRKPSGGRVFIEDTCCGALRISGPQPVIARQLDTEGGGARIANDGGNLAVLGLKTEGDCTVLDNSNAAQATILGGLLYIVGDADPKVPAFRDQSGSLEASFVEESLRSASHYSVYLQGAGPDIRAADFPPRGDGRIVPWLVSGAAADR